MSEHYVMTANQGHLRIYSRRQPPGQSTPAFDQVQAFDYPNGVKSFTDRESDAAGRFGSSKHQTTAPGSPMARSGMSIDERLPIQREEQRRRIRDVAESIDTFLAGRSKATWDFAAGPELHNAVLETVSAQSRRQLRHSVAKDLVHQPQTELKVHFAAP